MPRPRYIAFRIEAAAPVTRRALVNALKGRARHEAWHEADIPVLTRYAWPHGIVRVEHTKQANARQLLAGITWVMEGEAKAKIAIHTISTSGTLKALTERLGFLESRDEAK
jgi:RNase P/RNase MRP subunit POP5